MNEQYIKDIIEDLRNRYINDSDALAEIDREEKNIEYILKREQEPDYKGQTALQHLRMFMAELEYWN